MIAQQILFCGEVKVKANAKEISEAALGEWNRHLACGFCGRKIRRSMDEFKRIARESATVEEALNSLAQAGATPMYAIMALNQGRGVPLAAAKEAISKSSCWPDWDVTQETLVEGLENMDDSSFPD